MINRKLSSKIITGLFAVMVGVAGVQGVTAYASNYHDTKFEFSFENGGSDETEARAKEDDSYVYIKSTSCDGEDVGFRAYAYGCYSSDKSDGESLTPSGGSSIVYADGVEHRITNYVYETGRTYAYVVADLMGNESVGYYGVWSPDSIWQ